MGKDSKGQTIGVTVDVIGADGSYITVGGAAKMKNLGAWGDHLVRLKTVATQNGVSAKAYLSNNLPQELIDLTRAKLGAENVILLK